MIRSRLLAALKFCVVSSAILLAFAWCLSLAITMAVGILPYFHRESVVDYTAYYLLAVVVIYLSGVLVGPRKPRVPTKDHFYKYCRGIVVVIGLVFFSFIGGLAAPSLLGAIVKLLPGYEYSGIFEVLSVRRHIGKDQYVELKLRPAVRGDGVLHLVLSRRLFGWPDDVESQMLIQLDGKMGVCGVYIEKYMLVGGGEPGQSHLPVMAD